MAIKHLSPKSEDELRKSLANMEPYAAFKLACERGFFWLVKDVIEKRKIKNSLKSAGLLWAAQCDHVEIVEYLLSFPEINPADVDSVALRSAIYYNNADIVELLLNDGRSDPTSNDNEIIKDLYKIKGGHKYLRMDPEIEHLLMNEITFRKAYDEYIKKKGPNE